jgi:Predicted ATPase involved in cell division
MIRFENVGLRYGTGREVLSDLTFSIAPHSFQFLTGPSGAGKTTLIRLLVPQSQADARPDSIFGKDTALLRRSDMPALRRRIGVVFQDFRLLDHLTTYENVALPYRVLGKDEASYRPTSPISSIGSAWATASTSTRRFCRAVRSSAPPLLAP